MEYRARQLSFIEGVAPKNTVSSLSAAHARYIAKGEELFSQYKSDPKILEAELNKLELSYKSARNTGLALRGVTLIGFAFTVKDLTTATQRSVEQQSFKPVGAEVIRQTGGWAMAVVGAKLRGVAGGAMDLGTGPGAIVTGAIGAVVFGVVGYFGFDLLADQISPN